MTLLNKKSGLLAVSGKSLDTRVLMGDYDSNPQVKLAVHMFAYRLRKAIGSYLAALGSADAIIFEEGSVRTTASYANTFATGCAALAWKLTTRRTEP